MALKIVCHKSKKEFFVNKGNPLILGRGALTECYDKRVSRKHAEISILENDTSQLCALKMCLLMKSGKPPVTMVKDGETVDLKEGDFIAMARDSTWYEVCIDGMEPAEEGASRNSRESTPDDVAPMATSSVVPLSDTIPEEFSADLDGEATRSASPEFSSPASPSFLPGSNLSSVDNRDISPICSQADSTTGYLSTSEPLHANIIPKKEKTDIDYSKTRRLPEWKYEIPGGPPAKRLTLPSSSSQPQPGPSRTDNESIVNSSPQLVRVKTEPTESGNDWEEPTAATSQVTVKIEPGLTVVVPENGSTAAAVVSDDPAAARIAALGIGRTLARNAARPAAVCIAPAAAGHPSAQASHARPVCQYEGACYRRNDQHRADFSHPGDADWLPMDQRPDCPFGALCYRKSRAHRAAKKHPTRGIRRTRPRAPPPSLTPPSSAESDDHRGVDFDTDEDMDYDPLF